MDVNKIISLILGFLVVILLLVWVNNRFKARNATTTQVRVTATPTKAANVTPTPTGKDDDSWGIFSFLRRSTPTPSVKPTTVPSNRTITLPPDQARRPTTPAQTQPTPSNGYTTYNQTPPGQQKGGSVGEVNQIPKTGVSALFLPSVVSSLAFGIYLSRSRKS